MMPISSHTLMIADRFLITDNIGLVATDAQMQQARDFVNSFPKRAVQMSLLVVVSGDIDMRVNLQDYRVTAGQVLVVAAGAIIEQVDFTADIQVIRMTVDPKVLPALQHISHNNINRLYAIQVVALQMQASHFELLLESYQLLRHICLDEQLAQKQEVILSCLNMMGGIIAQGMPLGLEQRPVLSRHDEIVAHFLACVQEYYRRHRDLGFYADRLCLSLKYMSRVVYEQTGRHPSQWIRDYVILDAKSMLRSGRYTVQQIADALGFANQSFFGKYFKQAVGCSPKQYQSA